MKLELFTLNYGTNGTAFSRAFVLSRFRVKVQTKS
jgi:hypothetical protein